tara:strand:+ start:434 stop:928 length:495 start_codon:yes stop_codon:yes gene_type:complete
MYVDIFNVMKTIIKYDEEQYPVIYLRYFKDKLMYIGETKNKYTGRPFRLMDHSPVDKVRLLKTSKIHERRQYWEAVLICKLKPEKQNPNLYLNKLDSSHPEKIKQKRIKRIHKRYYDVAKKIIAKGEEIKLLEETTKIKGEELNKLFKRSNTFKQLKERLVNPK